jgi:hypothetical protein
VIGEKLNSVGNDWVPALSARALFLLPLAPHI